MWVCDEPGMGETRNATRFSAGRSWKTSTWKTEKEMCGGFGVEHCVCQRS